MKRSLRQVLPDVHFSAEATLAAVGQTLAAERISAALRAAGRQTQRTRKLPLNLVILLIVAMSLFTDSAIDDVLVKLLQGPQFLRPVGPGLAANKAAISQRRRQLGVPPLVALFRMVCQPLATPATPGAFLFGLRLMAIDGTIEDVADTPENARYFGYAPGPRGHSAFPQAELVYLCECGTHAICDVGIWPRQGQERTHARRLLRSVGPGILVLADAGLQSFDFCADCGEYGAHFLMRVSGQLALRPTQRLPDGSYLAELRATRSSRRPPGTPLTVRVIEYVLDDPGRPGHGQRHRLITSLLDSAACPAHALACAYHERWEVEISIDEIDTHQRSPRQPLRSRTPLGVLQELYGLLLAHYAVRATMHAAAQVAGCAPNQLSFTKTIRLLRNAVMEAQIVAQDQFAQWFQQLLVRIGRHQLPERDNRCNPRVVRRKMSKFKLKRAEHYQAPQPTKTFAQAIVISTPPRPAPVA